MIGLNFLNNFFSKWLSFNLGNHIMNTNILTVANRLKCQFMPFSDIKQANKSRKCVSYYIFCMTKNSIDSVVSDVNSAGKLSEAPATQFQSAKVSFNQFQTFT